MKFIAEINVMPHKNLLDPQGKAVASGLKSLGIIAADNVRVGKRITLEIDAASEENARQQVESACRKLLANPVMEYFEISLSAAQ